MRQEFSIKQEVPAAIVERLVHTLDQGLEREEQVKIFFRADDIGVPGANFSRMMAIFLKYSFPICLAVVPAWLTHQRWDALTPLARKGGDLFCWHQHGWRHRNHEIKGKNQEFGPGRPRAKISKDLERGRDRLQAILKDRFSPFFTPPWNRCTLETMEALVSLGFKGISRSRGSHPYPPAGLREISVDVDLHTRREKSIDLWWDGIFNEFSRAIETGVCGIMLHHMRMNDQAFIFLEALVKILAGQEKIRGVTFADLAGLPMGC
ncbi:MAG: polysaccharide deacetylase family protein [Desulfobacterium sp.]|jgi:hypothetical protein|nr:polysaccharide deacetylase family protein [Desulfobacterium sp.]